MGSGMQPLGLQKRHMSCLWVLVFYLQYFFLLWLHICFRKAIGLRPDFDIILAVILKGN